VDVSDLNTHLHSRASKVRQKASSARVRGTQKHSTKKYSLPFVLRLNGLLMPNSRRKAAFLSFSLRVCVCVCVCVCACEAQRLQPPTPQRNTPQCLLILTSQKPANNTPLPPYNPSLNMLWTSN